MNDRVFMAPFSFNELKRLSKSSAVLFLIILNVGCGIIPRNLEKYDGDVKSITYLSPIGVDARPPNGVDIYLFRTVMLRRNPMIGGGVEFAQVMYMRDSQIFVSLLAPYIFFSPVGIIELDEFGPDGKRGIRTRIMTFIYVGGSFLSIPRKKTPEDPSRSIYDFGAGLSFKKLEFRAGGIFKYRKSNEAQSIFWYGGLSYNLFGGKWKLEW